jgi:hypothetical protein
MELNSGLQAAGLGSRNTILAERALALLTGGPADSVAVVRECCDMPAVPPVLASHLAVSMLGGDSRFFRRVDGSSLRPFQSSPTGRWKA